MDLSGIQVVLLSPASCRSPLEKEDGCALLCKPSSEDAAAHSGSDDDDVPQLVYQLGVHSLDDLGLCRSLNNGKARNSNA
jgi:hypothetical protein